MSEGHGTTRSRAAAEERQGSGAEDGQPTGQRERRGRMPGHSQRDEDDQQAGAGYAEGRRDAAGSPGARHARPAQAGNESDEGGGGQPVQGHERNGDRTGGAADPEAVPRHEARLHAPARAPGRDRLRSRIVRDEQRRPLLEPGAERAHEDSAIAVGLCHGDRANRNSVHGQAQRPRLARGHRLPPGPQRQDVNAGRQGAQGRRRHHPPFRQDHRSPVGAVHREVHRQRRQAGQGRGLERDLRVGPLGRGERDVGGRSFDPGERPPPALIEERLVHAPTRSQGA
jgi:hypothetical protein